ncbi:MAG: hypothetical protein CME15_00090, partial [Gemmatimonadetes bacterium]|nr:hypothetical protein [Gemmatimonadota bacterium]
LLHHLNSHISLLELMEQVLNTILLLMEQVLDTILLVPTTVPASVSALKCIAENTDVSNDHVLQPVDLLRARLAKDGGRRVLRIFFNLFRHG